VCVFAAMPPKLSLLAKLNAAQSEFNLEVDEKATAAALQVQCDANFELIPRGVCHSCETEDVVIGLTNCCNTGHGMCIECLYDTFSILFGDANDAWTGPEGTNGNAVPSIGNCDGCDRPPCSIGDETMWWCATIGCDRWICSNCRIYPDDPNDYGTPTTFAEGVHWVNPWDNQESVCAVCAPAAIANPQPDAAHLAALI
jgi:hypothetical protein